MGTVLFAPDKFNNMVAVLTTCAGRDQNLISVPATGFKIAYYRWINGFEDSKGYLELLQELVKNFSKTMLLDEIFTGLLILGYLECKFRLDEFLQNNPASAQSILNEIEFHTILGNMIGVDYKNTSLNKVKDFLMHNANSSLVRHVFDDRTLLRIGLTEPLFENDMNEIREYLKKVERGEIKLGCP